MPGAGLEKDARLQVFASLIDHLAEKAPAENKLPALFHEFRDTGFKSAAYLMGSLALNNIYNFGHEDVFRVSEGLALDMETHREIIFLYLDAPSATNVFKGVLHFMKDNARYPQFEGLDSSFLAADRQNNLIEGTLSGNKILVTIKKP